MSMQTAISRRLPGRVRRWPAALLLPLLLLVPLGCNEDLPYEPLPGDDDETTHVAVVAGTVLDPAGEAVPDAVLQLEPVVGGLAASVQQKRVEAGKPVTIIDDEDDDVPAAAKGPVLHVTTSDDDGFFVFGDILPGSYLLTGTARNHLGSAHSFEVPPPAGAMAETTFVDIALTPTGSFLGTATLENASDHQGIVVYVQDTSYLAVTDPAGSYAITGVPVGSWTVSATRHRYVDQTMEGTIAAAGDSVTLTPILLRLDVNVPPTAMATAPAGGRAGAATWFDGAANDRDGSIVYYEWDFEDDGSFDYGDSTSASTSHVFADVGNFRARFRVTDDQGATAVDVREFAVYEQVFVASANGDDGNTGLPDQPLRTIQAGIDLASVVGLDRVVVADGTYQESPVFVAGIDIDGGWDASTWQPQPGQYASVEGGNLPDSGTACLIDGIAAPLTISGLAFRGYPATANDPNSIGLECRNSTADLVFESCLFTSDRGSDGANGISGSAGTAGAWGDYGQPGSCDGSGGGYGGSGGSGVCPGGAGGRGGYDDGDGAPGTDGGCGGGLRGNGGSHGDPGRPGYPGEDGFNGASGADGTPADSQGQIVSAAWHPLTSGSGTAGSSGTGGGGGGGGGGQDVLLGIYDGRGNGGGGGGAGGSGGSGGGGGEGGGASFAVYLYDASPTFIDCVFSAGIGGNGGFGASGGHGGYGGDRGRGATRCTNEIGRGGDGGYGGNGGDGGGGAGGPGGPSWGVYGAGTSVPDLTTGNVFTVGAGGMGGTGGGSGNDGPGGQAGEAIAAIVPLVPAPTPTVSPSDVISLFSDAYVDVPVDTWSASWDMADLSESQVAGDPVKLYTNLIFAGVEFYNPGPIIDATTMTHLHLDVWTPDGNALGVKLVDFGPDGVYGGGDDSEHELTVAVVSGTWNSLELQLSDFTGLASRANLAQLILRGYGSLTTAYVDNVYFHR